MWYKYVVVKLAHIDIETELWHKGYKLICGLDEVGRGPLAGPIVAGAVIYGPDSIFPEGIRDSKTLSAKQRNELVEEIKKNCICCAVAEVDNKEIDQIGIMKANSKALLKAIFKLPHLPDFHLIDHYTLPNLPKEKQMGITKGDETSISIASASILAKVHRDTIMHEIHLDFPQYGFDTNVGYGTLKHREALLKHGPCKFHRKSFIKKLL